MRRATWLVFFVLLCHASSLAATKEEERPDKEMLGLMDLLRDMDMVKDMELMRQMDTLERIDPPTTQTQQKNQPVKTKDR